MGRFALIMLVVALPLAGCSTDEILEVEDPDIVPPGSLEGPIGRASFFAGALGDFQLAYSGAAIGGGSTEGVVMYGGMLADEWIASGTFPTREQFDQRNISVTNGTLENIFSLLQRARVATENAAGIIGEVADTLPEGDSRLGELLSLAGYTYVFFAENYCSGVPFSTPPGAGEIEITGFGPQLTTEAIYDTAVVRFNSALDENAGVGSLDNLARVGLARTLLDQGNYQEAASVAAMVPTEFAYFVEHSDNTGRQENGIFALNTEFERWSVANEEGGGLAFRTANDGRVPVERDPPGDVGFDNETPQFNFLGFPAFGIELDASADVPLATGIEARLIEAEAALNANQPGEARSILNDLRANVTLTNVGGQVAGDLPPLTDPGTEAGRVDQLFRERAFWLYATGHRLSDLRRLVRQYNRAEDDVFPSGAYFKGGEYGDDVNFPIPLREANNPETTEDGRFIGCLDRAA